MLQARMYWCISWPSRDSSISGASNLTPHGKHCSILFWTAEGQLSVWMQTSPSTTSRFLKLFSRWYLLGIVSCLHWDLPLSVFITFHFYCFCPFLFDIFFFKASVIKLDGMWIDLRKCFSVRRVLKCAFGYDGVWWFWWDPLRLAEH